MPRVPRVAFFTDTFHEINGVALTSRQLTDFARRRDYPFLCVRGAEETRELQEVRLTHLELKRSRVGFSLDKGLQHDLLLWRHAGTVMDAIRRFGPDIIHVVSPGDVSEIGVYIAKKLRLPLAISWHTNLHEFGAMRLARAVRWLPANIKNRLIPFSETQMLHGTLMFYRLGDVLFAPNDELVQMLAERAGKPVFLMKRGIDAELFNPGRRAVSDGVRRLGYVGRITPEKNVRFLQQLQSGLTNLGIDNFRFSIVGDGSESEWLRVHLHHADQLGILRGQALAEAYANMDVFVFPSRTDTFGNVILEAFASGVPAIVTNAGGPRFIVRHGQSGFVAQTDEKFVSHTAQLLRNEEMRDAMGSAALKQARGESWDAVFEQVYQSYSVGIQSRNASLKTG